MVSGNPARAARQATLDEVRAAVANGNTALLRPWPGTEVTIKTDNPDYAESVVSFIEIMDPASRDLANVESLCALLDMFITAYAYDKRNTAVLKRWLNRAGEYIE